MTKLNNSMLVVSEKKKGNGTGEVLNLMKEVMDFQGKIDAAAEAQTDPSQRAAIEGFSEDIASMYEKLLEMAKGGIRSVRRSVEKDTEVIEDGDVGPEISKGKTSVISPTIPTM